MNRVNLNILELNVLKSLAQSYRTNVIVKTIMFFLKGVFMLFQTWKPAPIKGNIDPFPRGSDHVFDTGIDKYHRHCLSLRYQWKKQDPRIRIKIMIQSRNIDIDDGHFFIFLAPFDIPLTDIDSYIALFSEIIAIPAS